MIDEPRKSIYGGVGAAPAFKRINQRLACYYNYPPLAGTARLAEAGEKEPRKTKASTAPVVVSTARKDEPGTSTREVCGGGDALSRRMPDLTGRSIREALTLVSRYRGRVKISGQGRIAVQRPEPGAELKPGINFFFQLKRDI